MMRRFKLFLAIAMITFILSGCAAGPYKSVRYDTDKDLERRSNVVIMDKRLVNQFSKKRVVIVGEKSELTNDGRLRVFCEIRNMKKDTLHLQVQTVFKDKGNFSIGSDTNWELVLIPGFATYTYTTTALNKKAKNYNIRIKHAQ